MAIQSSLLQWGRGRTPKAPDIDEVDPDRYYERMRESRERSRESERYTAELYATGDISSPQVVI